MITSLDPLEDALQLSAAVCVIGAGPAGLEVARSLDATRLPVVLLEGGGFDYDHKTQGLHRIVSVGKGIRSPGSPFNTHLPLEIRSESRIRQFGGTSNVWSGKWVALSPDDFRAKPWIPYSGWPLRYEELLPYYRQIVEDYRLPPSLLDAEATRTNGAGSPAEDSLGRTIYYKQWPAPNFNEAFRAPLEASRNITVILNANVTRLVMDTDAARVRHALARSLAGKEIRLSAGTFVLAAGGLENPRLLLGLKGRAETGEDQDLIGRFFMDHPKMIHGRFLPGNPVRLSRFLRPGTRRAGVAYAFSLPPALRERHSLPNYRTELWPVMRRKGVFHRLRFRFLGLAPEYHLVHYLEQLPNPQSRVSLSPTDTDAFGEPLLVLDWRLTEKDRESFQAYLEILKANVVAGRMGTVTYPDGEAELDVLVDAAHHMGTARMGTSSADGVVDRNCKVFGIANLYVAGSAVFPTGGNANPMLTILALSRRLSHHLRRLSGAAVEQAAAR